MRLRKQKIVRNWFVQFLAAQRQLKFPRDRCMILSGLVIVLLFASACQGMSEGEATDITTGNAPSTNTSTNQVETEKSTEDQAISQSKVSNNEDAESIIADSNATEGDDSFQVTTNLEEKGTENVVAENAGDGQEVAEPEPDWLTVVERTEDNLMSLGNPNAAVTMIDYSDFL